MGKHLKIAFLSYFFPPRIFGGSSTYAFEFTKALSKLGHDVTVYTASGATNSSVRNPRVVPVGVSRSGRVSYPIYALSLFSSLRPQEFDVVHSQGGAGLLAMRIDVETMHHFPNQSDQLIFAIPSFITGRRARIVITVSDKSRDELSTRASINKRKIRVIHNGVSEEFLASLDSTEAHYSNDSNQKSILYINSELSKRKNLPFALEIICSVNKTTPCCMNIVGPSWGQPLVINEARKYGVEQQIRYYSKLSTPDLCQLYRNSDALIVTSTQEGFGIPIIEAIASGIPFVSYDVGIAPELANLGFGTVVHNKKDFLSQLMRAMENGKLDDTRGREFIARNFSWEQCAKQALKIYESV
jgi:glycosyltransferase involved in cell wall biosynthesis